MSSSLGPDAEALTAALGVVPTRLLANPTQADSESESYPLLRTFAGVEGIPASSEQTVTTLSYAHSGGFSGWSDVERAILHQYRIRNA